MEHTMQIGFVNRRIVYSLIIFAIALFMPAASNFPFAHPPTPPPRCNLPCGLLGYLMLQPMGLLLWFQPALAIIAYALQRRIREVDSKTPQLLIATGAIVFLWLPVYFYVLTFSRAALDPYLIIGLVQTAFLGVLLLLLAPGGWLFLLSTAILVHAGLRTRKFTKTSREASDLGAGR